MEEMGKKLLPRSVLLLVVLGANAILNAGTEDQKKELLPGIADGTTRAALAFVEPNGKWELDGIEREAVESGGNTLTGSKSYVVDGTPPTSSIVAAKDGGDVYLFTVDPDADGVTRTALQTLDMTRKQAKIDVQQHAGQAARREGHGSRGAHEDARPGRGRAVRGDGRRCAGVPRRVDARTRRSATSSDVRSVRFQAIKHKCANMLMEVEMARSAAYYAGWAAAEDPEELSLAASLAKAYCSDAFFHAAAENIQIHGGIGFTWEHDAHLYFRRAKSSEIYLGRRHVPPRARRAEAGGLTRGRCAGPSRTHRNALAFREEVRGWLREKLPAGWADAIETGNDREARQGPRRLGLHGLVAASIGESGYGAPLWPKEYGGLSGEPWQQNVVREELARYRLPTVGINILGVGLAGPTLDRARQRGAEDALPAEDPHVRGDLVPAVQRAGARVPTWPRPARAPSAVNGEWIVNGQKVWTSIAQLSQFGMLLARTDPDNTKHEGLSYFIVDMKSPGVDIRPLKQITGSSEFNEVYFTDVRIPAENIVGVEGDGWRVARTTLMNERVALSGLSLDAAVVHRWHAQGPVGDSSSTRSRTATSPVNRQFIAQCYIEKEVKEITQFRANSARMRGEQPGPEGAVTKVYNAEFNKWRSNEVMNVNGLAAIAWEQGRRERREPDARVHAGPRELDRRRNVRGAAQPDG